MFFIWFIIPIDILELRSWVNLTSDIFGLWNISKFSTIDNFFGDSQINIIELNHLITIFGDNILIENLLLFIGRAAYNSWLLLLRRCTLRGRLISLLGIRWDPLLIILSLLIWKLIHLLLGLLLHFRSIHTSIPWCDTLPRNHWWWLRILLMSLLLVSQGRVNEWIVWSMLLWCLRMVHLRCLLLICCYIIY